MDNRIFNLFAIVIICGFQIGVDGHYFGSSLSLWNHAISNDLSVLDNEVDWDDEDWDIEPGCNCLNGKCERLCIKEKNGVCRETGNVCVCGAEFFKVNEETCIYCGCGKGFNCTFHHVARTCDCTEGFHVLNNKCAAKCSKSKPCQNGGICKEDKCECKNGTTGIFCESSTWCKRNCNKPLLAECVYDEKRNDNVCLCKDRSLVYDFEERICKPCPCGEGTCVTQNDKLTCQCKTGYILFNKQCIPCDCGGGGTCLITENGEKSCQCKAGDFPRGEKCFPCDCGHSDATCKTNQEGRKVCICPYGFEDILGKCIKMNKDDRRCLCHPTANCIETFDDANEFNCSCNDGYKGKIHDIPHVGEECIDIDECLDSKSCPDRKTTECINFKGSFMCRCLTGYQPADISADSRKIMCKNYKMSWAPTGIVIGIIVIFAVLSTGIVVFLKKRSFLLPSITGIEMQNADFKK